MSWPLVKLTEVAEVNPRCPKDIDEDQIVSFVAMASASEAGLLLGEELRVLKDTKKGFTYFERGDVLLAKITPCFENGKTLRPYQIKNQVGFGSTEFHVVRADLEKLDPTYLFYLLWSDAFRFLGTNAMAGAAGQKRVGTPFLKQLEIPLPPLDEQKRIAAILDKADAIRQKRKQAIDLADEFLRSVFLDMFGDPLANPEKWEVESLGSLCNLITDGKHGDCMDQENSGFFFVSAKNIRNGQLCLDGARQINEKEFLEVHKRTNLKPGVLLLVNTGATIGKVAIAPNEEYVYRCTLQKSVAVIEPKAGVLNNEFLKQIIQLKVQNFASQGSGSAIKNLLLSQIREFPIIRPPYEKQKQFESIVHKIKAMTHSEELCKTESDCLFNSLSQKAFSGQL